jgi:hypothetical protein
MIKLLLETLVPIAIVTPIAIIFLKAKSKINFLRISIFTFCFIVYVLFLRLPQINRNFYLIESHWNWSGKIFGIIWGIICYFLFKKYFAENNFFTLKQNKKNFIKALIVAIAIILYAIVTMFFLASKSKFDFETLAFQLTLPAIDEEIMFRGILLGLLMSSLKSRIPIFGNPSVLLTALLFALVHALTFTNNYYLNFNIPNFIEIAIVGYVFGWITIKSRSIVLAIFSHSCIDFFGKLVTMIK